MMRRLCVCPGRPFVEVAVVPPVYRIVCVHPLARRSSRGLSRTPLWVGTSRSAVAGLPMLRGFVPRDITLKVPRDIASSLWVWTSRSAVAGSAVKG